jgi:putative sterol carrier protein
MLKILKKILLGITITLSPWVNANDFMDKAWAQNLCSQWNKSATLSKQLAGATWVDNNAGRGYKLIQMYRSECGASTKVQLTIKNQKGKAVCTYGGKPDSSALNSKVDYVMHAKDKHWVCMGAGKFGCGAAGAISTGKLQLNGPVAEAKRIMQPFSAFLKLVGQVPGKKGVDHCPR